MGMTIHEAQAKANKSLAKKIDDVMTNEVFEKVVADQGRILYEEVYAMPTSGRYKRRWDNGGLFDPDNTIIEGGSAKGGVLVIVNVTKPNPFKNGENTYGGLSSTSQDTPLAGIVEYGRGYDWWPGKPRPFIQVTRDYLRESKIHVSALRDGLRRRGLNVK